MSRCQHMPDPNRKYCLLCDKPLSRTQGTVPCPGPRHESEPAGAAVRPTPAFVNDDPLMAGAFASFMSWLWDQDEAHAAFCEESGMTKPTPARNPIDAAIDKATGHVETYMEAFVAWGIRNHWGEAGAPAISAVGP